ncbi:MAG: OsmC family protein [Anaerolineae bacterium]|jgi:putative redox protein
MEAKVTWVEDQRYVGQATSGHGVVVDASAEKVGPSPMELVLMGMAACTAYDVVEILKKKRQAVAGLEVQARAERAQTPPRVYTAIAVEYVVRGRGVQAKAVEDAIRLSLDKYCSVSNMLNQTATITSEYRIEESD